MQRGCRQVKELLDCICRLFVTERESEHIECCQERHQHDRHIAHRNRFTHERVRIVVITAYAARATRRTAVQFYVGCVSTTGTHEIVGSKEIVSGP